MKKSYVVTARSPIIKAKSKCPACSKIFVLQPAFSGKKAACQSCGVRLLITADFSEVQQIEIAAIRGKATSSVASNISAAESPGETVLVLGQQVFGWKLSRQWALGLGVGLMLFLLLLTVYFTDRVSRAEGEKLKEQYRPSKREAN